LLYVDQPVGTGFSHAGILHAKDKYGRPVVNEDEVAENMATFLIKFIEKYP
jgi:carboxypeptidase C (cathepsin A)